MKYSVIQIITMATLIFITVALLLTGYRLMRHADNTLSSETYHMKTTSDLLIQTDEEKYLREEGSPPIYYGYNVKILIAKYPTKYKLATGSSLEIGNGDEFTLDKNTNTFRRVGP